MKRAVAASVLGIGFVLVPVVAAAADATARDTTGVVITFSGLPPTFSPDAMLSGPGGFSKPIGGSQTIVGLAPGEYTLTSRTVPVAAVVQTYDPVPASKVVVLDAGSITTLEIAYRPTGYPIVTLWFRVLGNDYPWIFVNATNEWQRGDDVCDRVVLQFRSTSACDWTTVVESIGHSDAGAGGPNPKPPFVYNGFILNTPIQNLHLPPDPIEWRFYPAAPASAETSQPPFSAVCGLDTPKGGRYWYPVSGGVASGILNTPTNPSSIGPAIEAKLSSGQLRFRRF